jgi:tRNA-2-methylthio-N6-dimethylallyladenosine synthase
LKDDIPEDVKKRRLEEIIAKQNQHALLRHRQQIGTKQIVLLEYTARRSDQQLVGRTDGNKKVVIAKDGWKIGDYVEVEITDCTQVTLFGNVLKKMDL